MCTSKVLIKALNNSTIAERKQWMSYQEVARHSNGLITK